jgi:GcrA cell cycle regulator
MTWNDEKVAKLEELWRTALYASQIAEQIGGVTRNAVIGKAHRLGLPMRENPLATRSAGRSLTAE